MGGAASCLDPGFFALSMLTARTKQPTNLPTNQSTNLQLMLKDLRLVMQMASATKTPAPMTQGVAQLYRQVVDATADGAPVDFSAIFKYVHSSLPGPE